MGGEEQEKQDMERPPFREDQAFTKKKCKTYNVSQSKHDYRSHVSIIQSIIFITVLVLSFFLGGGEVFPVEEIRATSFPAFRYQAAAP